MDARYGHSSALLGINGVHCVARGLSITRVRIPVGSLASPLSGGLFLRQKENRKPCSHRRASERLGQGVRLEGHPRPEYEREHEEEDEA